MSSETIDEAVTVVEYRFEWPALASEEAGRLVAALAGLPAVIEHIGSTAVPGLAAKPVIDLMLGTDTYPPDNAVNLALLSLGYVGHGEAGVSGRLYFALRGAKDVNVHAVATGREHWRTNLALRDYLRSSSEARTLYAEAKRKAVEDGARTLLAYSAAKASTVAALVAAARSARDGG